MYQAGELFGYRPQARATEQHQCHVRPKQSEGTRSGNAFGIADQWSTNFFISAMQVSMLNCSLTLVRAL